MRWLLSLVLVLLAAGTLRVVGCGESAAECQTSEDCDDQNVCTDDYCRRTGGQPLACEHELVEEDADYSNWGIVDCSLDGGLGYCVKGVCEEDSCDDGDTCSDEVPDILGDCVGVGVHPDGTPCIFGSVSGVCIWGTCQEYNPCENVVCDDGNLCTTDRCDYRAEGACSFTPVGCSDGNQCTSDICDPETGDCVNVPGLDGSVCCLRYEERCEGILFPICWSACVSPGECRAGICE